MNRRSFINKTIKTGAAVSTLPFVLDGLSVQAFSASPFLASLAALGQTNRVLVIVVLDGGNDGLNTVIPFENASYYNSRPTIRIKKSDVLKITSTIGLNPSLSSFDTLYKDGKIALLQNVGYDSPNRSHFRSMDIWNTGTDYNSVLDTGWLGRYLDMRYPNYPATSPAHPVAIQIGSSLSLALQGPKVGMGMALFNVEQFYQLIQGTDTSGGYTPPATRAGDELKFIRHIQLEAQNYNKPIRESYNSSTNKVTYPYFYLAQQLQVVARLLSGQYLSKQLETPVYIVRINGFDTHAGQAASHGSLLTGVSQSISAFLQDCKANGVDDRVLVMTMSEFGRRVNENGTSGTDHGTCAPHFVIGNAVKGGVFGHDPDLTNLDAVGDMKYEIDYRQMYASILEQWFGVTKSDITSVFNGKSITTLPIITGQTSVDNYNNIPNGFSLEQNYPNPIRAGSTTQIRFSVQESDVKLKVFDLKGAEVATLVNTYLKTGSHEIIFNTAYLSSGSYMYRLSANGFSRSRMMTIVK